MFTLAPNRKIYFGDCNNCEANCCSGTKGIIFTEILIDDIKKHYDKFPVTFIFGSRNYTKAVIIISNGKTPCPYLIDNRCSIYEQRPNPCRTYPLSPNIDNNIYIDLNCPEIDLRSKDKTLMLDNLKPTKEFKNDIYGNYQERYLPSHNELEKLDKTKFEKIMTINGIDFFEYMGDINSEFLEQHKKSLVNLKKIK